MPAQNTSQIKKRTDIYSRKKRSEIMGSVRGRGTLLELNFAKALRKAGFRFSCNVKRLPGKPDIVFRKEKIVIFVDGCFWHGCKKHFKLPQTNQWFWEEKIGKNVLRDRHINKFYNDMGWMVKRVWEHDAKKKIKSTVNFLNDNIK